MKVKYPSIENSYREKNLDWIRTIVPEDELWEVTEKLHGSNCYLFVNLEDGDEHGFNIRVGKRKTFLKPDENFYGYSSWFNRDYQKFNRLFKEVQLLYERHQEGVAGIAIFGETFGGLYPHLDVSLNPHAQRVQKGVFYTPDNEFYAFDIAVYYQDETVDFLSMSIRNKLFEMNDIFYANPLFTGSLGACLAFNHIFQSHIPRQFGLPVIEENFAEGVVIKPVKNYFFANGKRVILKNKNPKHQEKDKKIKTKAVLPEHLQPVFETLCQYITEARFQNVESHEGKEFEFKDFKELRGLYIKDLWDDFLKDNPNALLAVDEWTTEVFSKDDLKILNQFLGKEVNNNLRVWLKR